MLMLMLFVAVGQNRESKPGVPKRSEFVEAQPRSLLTTCAAIAHSVSWTEGDPRNDQQHTSHEDRDADCRRSFSRAHFTAEN